MIRYKSRQMFSIILCFLA